MKYKYLFFDLDHTLWDYEANSKRTLEVLFSQFHLKDYGMASGESLYEAFREVNYFLWEKYDLGQIDVKFLRGERFNLVLEKFRKQNTKLADQLSEAYLEHCPTGSYLLPHAIETLEYLSKKYQLTIITNGFEDTQHTKMASGNITHYFDHVITSQRAGCKKPGKEIFEYALKLYQAKNHEALMIGDNLITDIGGARKAQMDAIFFNPESIIHHTPVAHEIKSLKELCELL